MTRPDGTPVDPFPAAVDDVKTAVRFLKANAGRYDLRASEIFLSGVSAGGHLAALAGTSAAVGLLEPQNIPSALVGYDSRVRAVIDVVGISDVKAWGALDSVSARGPVAAFLGCPEWKGGEVDCPASAYAPASVATYLSPVSPPAFLAYATQDVLVPPRGARPAARDAMVHGDRRQQRRLRRVADPGPRPRRAWDRCRAPARLHRRRARRHDPLSGPGDQPARNATIASISMGI